MDSFKPVADAILNRVITSNPRVPGVVAMATDKRGNFYEGGGGQAGDRRRRYDD
jgi:methyl acetate hydrolase